MSDWDKVAADAAIEYAKPTMRPVQTMSDHMADAFHEGARWQREALLSEESVERAMLGIHASHDRGDWDEELPVVQDEYLDMARAALAAALGEAENDE